jgi:signal transduction histidine kinase
MAYPVRILGVVTDDVPEPDFFVQDKTAGIYVEGSQASKLVHRVGDIVEIEGVTAPGKFAPVIQERKTRVVGKGRLPKTTVYSFAELADGRMDSQWVQVRGTIRSAAIDQTSWPEVTLALRVTSGGGEFSVRVPIQRERDFSYLVDNEVLIEGVCGSRYTSQRQLSGILFYVPRLSFISIESPAPEVAFSAVLRFSPDAGLLRRVRVRGVVTHQQAGNALFLQSGEKGLRVLTRQDTRLQVGDEVEVFGFPEMGESAPVLADAVFHRVGHVVPPVAVKLALDSPWEQYDGALVITDAVLLDRRIQLDGIRLLLRTGEQLFEALLQAPEPKGLRSIPLNSQVRITGVCLVRSGGLWAVPQSFRMLLRSPQDIVVLQTPSWWNLHHLISILGVTAGISLMVLVGAAVLGKRLRKQIASIPQKPQNWAVLEERNRIARELHDTLEQELTAITMQLDLVADCFQDTPRVAQQALDTARSMSRHCIVEARRSVWDLRCHLLEHGDLASALERVVEPLVAQTNPRVDVRVVGSPVRLHASIEMNLLRIGQEAVANALKHGLARNVAVELRYAPDSVRLEVVDDGHGFVPDETPAGHFGLLDMRERAQCMDSWLHVESDPGTGTSVSIEVPINCGHVRDEELKADTYSGR